MENKEMIKEIVDLLKGLTLRNEDFKGHTADATSVHFVIIKEVGKQWSIKTGVYTEKFTDFGIDFIGRKMNYGKIILAMEVDQGHRGQRSWTKLADIRAEIKMWVYITDKPTMQAERYFKLALDTINRFLKFRGEDQASFGKFAAVLKTPEIFKIGWILE